MRRVILLLVLAFVTITVAVLVHARDRVAAQTAPQTSSASAAPEALILQEGDGDRLVHRAGPLAGAPFIIKLDGEKGMTQDFFVFTETLEKGQTIPFHKHDNAEEILLIEEGGLTVIVGNKRAVAGPRSIVFIPRDTWISATNTSGHEIHGVAVFSRRGFEQYMRAIGVKEGQPLTPIPPEDLPGMRAMGHAMYWDTAKGPYPPGVAHP